EPTAEMDHEAANVVIEALREVSRRGGGVILASHDPRVLLAADRALLLRAGRLVAEGSPGEVGGVLTDRPRPPVRLNPGLGRRLPVAGTLSRRRAGGTRRDGERAGREVIRPARS